MTTKKRAANRRRATKFDLSRPRAVRVAVWAPVSSCPVAARVVRPLRTSRQARGEASTRATHSAGLGSRAVSRCTTRTAMAPDAAARRSS